MPNTRRPASLTPTPRSTHPSLGALELGDRDDVEDLVGEDDGWRGHGLIGERAEVGPPADGASMPASVVRCTACSAVFGSTSTTSIADLNAGTARAARSASRIRVPRPGPTSTSRTRDGLPICCQTTAAHSPISSPKTCEISGAVMKSSFAPMAVRVR